MKSAFLVGSCTLVAALLQLSGVVVCESSSDLLRREAEERQQSEKKLVQLCSSIREIKHLSKMQELITLLRTVMADQDFIEFSHKSGGRWLCGFDHSACWMWQICADQADAIVDLQPLLDEKDNVCKSSHIDQIEAYHNKYVQQPQGKPITYNFFYLYASQVSITCKKNLLHSLNMVDQDVAKGSYEKVVSWLAPFEKNNSCSRTLSDIIWQASHENEAGNLHETSGKCCDSIQVFTKIKMISDLVNDLGHTKSKTHKDSTSSDLNYGLSRNPSSTESDSNIPSDIHDSIEEIRSSCAKLEPIYTNTIIPIVRLAAMRIDPIYKEFEKKCKTDKLIQHWFIITLVCNSMLSCNLVKVPKAIPENYRLDNEEGNTIPEGAPPSADGVLKPEERAFLMSNTLEDELWIKKYLPTRLSKLKTELVKSITKIFKIEQLLENPNLRRSFKFGQNAVIGLTLVGLTIVGMDSDVLF